MTLKNERRLQQYWIEETTYIMSEMYHAISQTKKASNEEDKTSWLQRSLALRHKAKMCIDASFEHIYDDSNKEEEKNNE